MTRIRFSLNHVGIYVIDIDKQTDFYTSFFGFVVTDERTETNPIRFLTLSPDEHHQLVLLSGRAPDSPSTVAQLSFLLEDFAALRRVHEAALNDPRAGNVLARDHGNSWAVYFKDPEDNLIETYVHTPWHVSQPYGTPIDFSLSDEEIYAATEKAALADPSYMPVEAFQARIKGLLAA